ncbi:hypothetical protein ACWIGW_02180 [Nocardia brasiliensis]
MRRSPSAQVRVYYAEPYLQDAATDLAAAPQVCTGRDVRAQPGTLRTPEQIAAVITMPLRVMAQQTRGAPQAGSYPELAALGDAVGEPAP